VLDPKHQEDQMSFTDKPTTRQLAYLRQLAIRLGQSFTYPRTSGEASAEIRRLQASQRGRDHRLDRRDARREQRAISRDIQKGAGDAARVDLDREATGYGASATWR
jgi:hypothetical protein